MQSFLNLMAADMLAYFSNDMRDVTVVFPGKRADMFLNRELALLSEKPVWTPGYCTMGDLFQSLTSLQVADPIECICQLYCVMQEVLGKDYTETLDDFWSWGEVLMADFDDIDKHQANAQAIFTNIADWERLGNFDYLDDHQRETLKRFFGHFSLDNSSKLQAKFLHTWSHMFEIYTKLHDRLLAEGKLWEGALFRYITELMKSDESLILRLLNGKRAIVFAGFNVLNNVEHTLMSLIKREKKARFYWDYDTFYCDPKANFEAGYFMKQNLRDFPCAISDSEAFSNFRYLRDVTFISCTTDNAAARYANTFISQPITHNPQPPSLNQAIVLCNETLMQPVLHAIPETTGEVNVTMGFPISDTPIYGIIMALLKLQIEGYDADRKRFRYPIEQALRRQPLFELLNEKECFAYHGKSTNELLDYLLTHMQQIASHYAQIEEPGIFEQLYSETTYRINKMLRLMKGLFTSPLNLVGEPVEPQPSTLRHLLRQMMMSTKIPFHSEPDRGLQVMGMLETRCLDFPYILLLSVEEGNLPRNAYDSSFIPESLREAFGMTTWRHRIAVYAYYFYRLVQRCEHLTCVYNESCSDGVQHEMSRFLRQMLAETDIPIRTHWLQSEPKAKPAQPLEVGKTPEVMECLYHRYDQNLPGGEGIILSPSAINTYMACPIKFYLNNILRIRREDDPREGISADIIGNIFHDTAEFFYKWLARHHGTDTITADMLCKEDFTIKEHVHRELQKMLHAAFDACWFHPNPVGEPVPEPVEGVEPQPITLNPQPTTHNPYKGTTLIAHDVLLRYLQELIRFDARHAPFRIIGAEEERTIDMSIGSLRIKVGGRIDRIDEMDGHLRIVDYKTGSYRLRDKVRMENVVSLDKEHEPYYLQTFIYALAETESRESTLPIQPVLYFPIRAALPDYDPRLAIEGEIIDDFENQHAEAFRKGLENILSDIFNPDKPFTCTTDRKVCEYCKLGLICGRKSG